MSDFDKNPTDAATRKPDEVGKPGAPAVGGGHQTAQQAAITGQGSEQEAGDQEAGGRTDADRKSDWDQGGGAPGRNPTPVGGSSDGQSDRKR